MTPQFTVTINGIPKLLPVAGTTVATSRIPPPRTWVKLLVDGRIIAAFLIDQPYDEALRRRDHARKQR